ncbi:hypothetical protein JL107_00010 [Nakamurella flavida]|uniref:Uncharacterized protein n=1 Tax=Nakamurella flavida TaxID=363630 RepID=A0A938YHP2_9ACTN|nr:hypothetical protein [Nakamurella flavida]MBM9474821.1 hypothetical protein [Nakamurella flavida]MDP9776391.1 hypothetical protein [Nakamurella flavida]
MEPSSARRRRRPPRSRPTGGSDVGPAGGSERAGPATAVEPDAGAEEADGADRADGDAGSSPGQGDRGDQPASGRSASSPSSTPRSPQAPPKSRRERQEEASDRFLRALVTHRGTQVSSEAAMRAREAGTPTAQDLADAERDVVVKRRYYTPTEDLPTGRTRGRAGPRS